MTKAAKLFIFSLFQYIIHLIIFYAAFRLTYNLRFFFFLFVDIFPPYKGIPAWDIYAHAVPFILLIWTVVTLFSGYYKKDNMNNYDDFFYTCKEVTTTFFIIMALTFMYREVEYSRMVISLAWAMSITLIFASRIIFRSIKSMLHVTVFGHHHICVLGKGKSAGFLRELLNHKKGYKAYFYETEIKENVLRRFIKRRKIEEVLVIRNDMNHEKMLTIAALCESMDVDFRFVPDIFEIRMGELIFDQSFGIPMFRLKPMALHGFNFYYKRIFDILVAIVLIALFFIPMLIIGFLIWVESPGKILYLQNRVGHKSKHFLFYKFRTMIPGADDMIDQIKHLSERTGPVFKMRNDPRVTRVGRFLRAFSIDEIPQVINVVKGEMSIVGPRPQVIWEAQAYDEVARKRLNILPGITGLWQVSGRASLSYEEMINLDIYYLENWSPGLDIKIILMTLPTILTRVGAF